MYGKYMKIAFYQRDRVLTPVQLEVWREEALTDQRKSMVVVGTNMKEIDDFSQMVVVHAVTILRREATMETMFTFRQNEGGVLLQEGKTTLTLLKEDPERILMLEGLLNLVLVHRLMQSEARASSQLPEPFQRAERTH